MIVFWNVQPRKLFFFEYCGCWFNLLLRRRIKGNVLLYVSEKRTFPYFYVPLGPAFPLAICNPNLSDPFQIITPFRRLILCAENRKEMEDWITSLKSVQSREHYEVSRTGLWDRWFLVCLFFKEKFRVVPFIKMQKIGRRMFVFLINAWRLSWGLYLVCSFVSFFASKEWMSYFFEGGFARKRNFSKMWRW